MMGPARCPAPTERQGPGDHEGRPYKEGWAAEGGGPHGGPRKGVAFSWEEEQQNRADAGRRAMRIGRDRRPRRSAPGRGEGGPGKRIITAGDS